MSALSPNEGSSGAVREKEAVVEEVLSGSISSSGIDVPQQIETAGSPTYPPLAKTILVALALYIAVFLVSLDRLIVATATPKITDHFHSIGDIGWYGSSYMLAASASQLTYGRIYTFYPIKWVFLLSIFVFEVGSAICGAAPSSFILILGRAIAGLGTAGIYSGAVIIIALTVPLRLRPVFQGAVGAIIGVSSVLGPILGGVFTTEVSWRWCFYINLPLGGLAVVAIFFLLDVPPPEKGDWSLREKFNQLDPIGNLLMAPAVTCLLLALQWGGTTYDWSNWRIIFLFGMFGTLFGIFAFVEYRLEEKAMVPPRIFKQRSVLAGIVFTMCTSASTMVMLYYLPIWFQAIKNVDAEKSGIMNLPLVLAMVVGSIGSGSLVSLLGYYNPFMFAGVIFMSIGAGLLSTFQPDADHPKWIGYQVIFGFGLGLGVQQANVAVQTCLDPVDIPVGASLLMFSQQLNGAVFLAVAQNLFTNFLTANLNDIEGSYATWVIASGATTIRKLVAPAKLAVVLKAYSDAIMKTFVLALAMSCLALFPTLAMEWKNVKRVAKGIENGDNASGSSDNTRQPLGAC
ncbi:MDR family MFS transporter [Aspergillus vadensis CBS 113365]|uniref:MFS general substrate transporter n=1 Tax=Aspergillus vadensis (strain CBS 113365 / IMI 142717 / IBT 24658) TaxID=1448311 RepID=A0A319BRE0_ASPVC|nr:MFS general substrate transporter [Aspergillus vadensis CBS 113365]PYH75064.1 MFS general substrate transporter [Aspergillus vadensis CBS 113365]